MLRIFEALGFTPKEAAQRAFVLYGLEGGESLLLRQGAAEAQRLRRSFVEDLMSHPLAACTDRHDGHARPARPGSPRGRPRWAATSRSCASAPGCACASTTRSCSTPPRPRWLAPATN
ncbi:MAG: hypothetical protein LW862_20965 [Rubrivivax sp.]|nr:hypothetical protein [Rubrivivax sp.]